MFFTKMYTKFNGHVSNMFAWCKNTNQYLCAFAVGLMTVLWLAALAIFMAGGAWIIYIAFKFNWIITATVLFSVFTFVLGTLILSDIERKK